MANTARDLIKCKISNTPGTSGGFTLSTAVGNFLLPESTDNGLTFKLNITENGVGTEIRRNCTYTHSTTTFSRGTMVRSTAAADAALNFTDAAIVSVVPSAEDYLTTEQAAAARTMTAVKRMLLTFGQPELLPIPTRTTPYKITGNTYYVDPTVGGAGTGTFADPYKSPASATLAAGDGLLFKAGTTTIITAAIAPAVTGTSGSPIVFGVYDGASTATDKRIYGRQGIATIDAEGAAIKVFNIDSKSYIAIDGLAVTGNSGANALISVTGTSANCQITNNAATGGASHHYSIVGGLGNVVEGNSSVGSAGSGIWYQVGSTDSNIKINFNFISGYATNQRGIVIYDGYSGITVGGVIACNTIIDQTTPISTVGGIAGISSISGACSLKVFRNVVRNCAMGVGLVSSLSGSTVSSDMSGMLIQNNDISNCEFNIGIGLCFGSWVVEYNRLSDAGALTSGGSVTTTAYGRNIEIFGVSEAGAVSDGIVRFNYCSGAYNWSGAPVQGTEGVGIGIDNRTKNVQVYGNYCVNNEGNGIQINSAYGNHVFGNLCFDNCAVRASHSVTIPDELKCEISFVLTPYLEIFNNTCVSTGRSTQKYSISDSDAFVSTGAHVYNNLLIGATTAGVRRNVTAGATTEDHNIVVGAPVAVIDTDGTTITNGTGTAIATTVGAVGDFYRPAVGSSCDGAGAAVPGVAVSLDGKSLALDPPIGALIAE